MSRYYCPFCTSRYQIQKTSSDGILICGQCGDPLTKKPLINLRQLCGVFAIAAFLAPLVIMIVFAIEDINNDKHTINSKSLVL